MAVSKKWVIYNIVMAFALYWLSNLILWYPWSISSALGITLMLTVSPLVWIIGIISCFKRYTGEKYYFAASINAFVFLMVSIIIDYVFFGVIRGAIAELYEPTTFYGYLFLVVLPFIVMFFRKKYIANNSKDFKTGDILKVGLTGLLFMSVIIVIIVFDLNI